MHVDGLVPRRQMAGSAGIVFHVMNRGVRRLALFEDQTGYELFLRCLIYALRRVPVDLMAYCVMPNHFHLVVRPGEDSQLSAFMKRLTSTHSKRWHGYRRSVGTGAVYQGRFRAFPVQTDGHFLTVCRYVERNALRARLVRRAEDWPWSSAAQRCSNSDLIPLAPWPILPPHNWLEVINSHETVSDATAVRQALLSGLPLGDPAWRYGMIRTLGLEGVERGRGHRRTEKTSGVFPGQETPEKHPTFF